MEITSSPDRSTVGEGTPLLSHPRWSIVTTPGAVPTRKDQRVKLPKNEGDAKAVGAGFHDWVEDQKWAAVDHARTLRTLPGGLAKAWYRSQGWIAVVGIGILVGTVGAMIHISVMWLHGLTRGYCVDAWYLNPSFCGLQPTGFLEWHRVFDIPVQAGAVVYTLVSCIFTTISSCLVVNLAPKAGGAGIAEIKAILGGAEVPTFSSVLTGLVKWCALVFAVGGSLSIGKAAPIVHVAFCIGDTVAGCFSKYRVSIGKRRELLTAAAAAGISVAFGAPLGGVLYAFEETSTYFSAQTLYRSLVCSVVAAATLQAWGPYLHGQVTLFAINYQVNWKFWEIPLFVIVGACGGLVGYAFSRAAIAVSTWRKTRKAAIGPIREVLMVTVVTCCLQQLFLPSGRHRTDAEYLEIFFRHCKAVHCAGTLSLSLVLGVLKFFLTALSFGLMVPAGLFMPNLVIGASLGWFFGNLFDSAVSLNPFNWLIFQNCETLDDYCVVPAVYAMVGSAAVMGGVNRMTLSLITIMVELTGGIPYIIPITIGVFTSKWVAEALGGKDNIYNMLMDVKGIPFLDPRFEGSFDLASPIRLADMNFDLFGLDMIVLYEKQSMGDILAAIASKETGFPIVKSAAEPKVVGFISKRQLLIALEDLGEELDVIETCAHGDVDVILGKDVSYHAPVGLKRTPSILTPTPGVGVQRIAYDLHGYVDHSPITVRPEVEMSRVVFLFQRLGLSSILVVNAENHLMGVLTKLAVISHLQTKGSSSSSPAARTKAAEALLSGSGVTSSSSSDLPRGGFHQSEREAEVPTLQSLPDLPPGAMILRRRSAKRV